MTLSDGIGGTDTLISIENLTIRGFFENDHIIGSAFNDLIYVFVGEDLVEAGGGDDVIVRNANGWSGQLYGEGGDDIVRIQVNPGNADFLDGEAGTDIAQISFFFPRDEPESIKLSLVNGVLSSSYSQSGSSVNGVGIEAVHATGYMANDDFKGAAGDDFLRGLGGSDKLAGGAGDDILGGDVFFGSPEMVIGNDILNGGEGHDLYYVEIGFFSGGGTWDYSDFDVSGGTITIDDGYGGADRITSIEGVFVEAIYASSTLIGSRGGDRLLSGDGADVLKGGGGADILMSGAENDVMVGGAGRDVFVFTYLDFGNGARDLIRDLRAADRIDLSALDANGLVDGNNAFVLVHAPSGAAGELWLTYDAASNETLASFDTTGDGIADGVIRLLGDHRDFTGFIL